MKSKLRSPSPARVARDLSPAGRSEGASHSAVEAAIAEIHSAFDKAAEINFFKRRVARWLRFGPQHPAVRARFRARAAALPQWRLDAAIREVEHWWREERKTFALASALGYGSRLPLETRNSRR